MLLGRTLQCIADVDDKRSRTVFDISPNSISTPNLEASNGHREQQGRCAKIGVSKHLQAFTHAFLLMLERMEEGVSEIALVH